MNTISAQGLIDNLKNSCKSIPDERKGNALKYPMIDTVMGAFSVFFTQSPSFLAYQRDMERRTGKSNANTLFKMDNIPTDNQIRNILDKVNHESFVSVFEKAFKKMKESGILSEFKTELGTKKDEYLIALDGIEYHSSYKIHCDKCLTRTKNKKTRYCHCAITPTLVKPGKSEVIPLAPEFILPQDGDEKQDCENKAAKRWLEKQGTNFSKLSITILGDDLYSRQPVIESITNEGFSYILVFKPQSHKWANNWIKALEKKSTKYLKPDDILHTYVTKKWNGKDHIISTYEYALNVPIKDGGLKANWVQLTQTKEKSGEQIYKNSFITDHSITDKNVESIVTAGRTRWKVENENNNTLTTKGYHFKHNYGHGTENLSATLATLILIAYLFHTLLDMGCELYKNIRKEVVVREVFFNHIKTLTTFFNWESWDQLFDFMWKKLNDLPATAPE